MGTLCFSLFPEDMFLVITYWTKAHRMMILVSRTLSLGSLIQMANGAIHFFLYMVMLNLSSLKSMKLVIILFTNRRNVLTFLHVLALIRLCCCFFIPRGHLKNYFTSRIPVTYCASTYSQFSNIFYGVYTTACVFTSYIRYPFFCFLHNSNWIHTIWSDHKKTHKYL